MGRQRRLEWGPLGGTAYSGCVGKPFPNQERKPGCGLGWELGLLLPLFIPCRRSRGVAFTRRPRSEHAAVGFGGTSSLTKGFDPD